MFGVQSRVHRALAGNHLKLRAIFNLDTTASEPTKFPTNAEIETMDDGEHDKTAGKCRWCVCCDRSDDAD